MDQHQKRAHHTRKKTFNRMRYRAMRGKLGKPTPQWTLPRGLWKILFMPNKFIKIERGALRPEASEALTAPWPRAPSTASSARCWPTNASLHSAVAAKATSYPSPNGDQRLIHALCSVSKDFMREVYSDSTRQAPGFSYGGYSRRQCEGAILQKNGLERTPSQSQSLTPRTLVRYS